MCVVFLTNILFWLPEQLQGNESESESILKIFFLSSALEFLIYTMTVHRFIKRFLRSTFGPKKTLRKTLLHLDRQLMRFKLDSVESIHDTCRAILRE